MKINVAVKQFSFCMNKRSYEKFVNIISDGKYKRTNEISSSIARID